MYRRFHDYINFDRKNIFIKKARQEKNASAIRETVLNGDPIKGPPNTPQYDSAVMFF